MKASSTWEGTSGPLQSSKPRRSRKIRSLVFLLCILALCFLTFLVSNLGDNVVRSLTDTQKADILAHCKYLRSPAGPSSSFHSRTQSDRFVPGTKPVLLRNAKIWTGARNGTELVDGDVLLDGGIIKGVGYIPGSLLDAMKVRDGRELEVVDLDGAWVTPGLVDLHSHIGVGSSPSLNGASDTNSHNAPILPWLRSIDGLNTHDDSYELTVAGGVTTAQVLPGSANNIGGQSFVIKLRPTEERSVISKVIEPPHTLNGSDFDHSGTPRWRHMKHACGENPDRRYSQSRMDAAWNFRQAYNEAKKVMQAQDAFCEKAESGLWDKLRGGFPDNLQWEALVDVLRGRVKLSIHCYEAVDLDVIVRLSNEFKFPVASFHHAGETYLVPDLIKKTWGGVPSIALFAANFRKKREAYRGSEFAPRILADHGIPVVMKSDHPVLNSRYLLYEAQQAHYHGLNPALALASVTSTPANAAGLGHRVGSIAEGYDADVVVWDSHPLALGATPAQVYIDGIPQLSKPHITKKPPAFQELPKTPDFEKEARDAVKYDGLPPLERREARKGVVRFVGVGSMYARSGEGIQALFDVKKAEELGRVGRNWTVVVKDGKVVCYARGSGSGSLSCPSGSGDDDPVEEIDLRGGSLAPGLTTFGAPIGLVEIRLEPSTNDGVVYDPLIGSVPSILGGDKAVVRAVDGLQFGGRNTLLSYRGGVTKAITAPTGSGFLLGLSTAFAVGASGALEVGAIIQDETALHVAVHRGMGPSVSTQIGVLRRALLHSDFGSTAGSSAWERVRQGAIPLVVHVESADIMATLLTLKSEYEASSGQVLKLTFAGATEAHLLAEEIGKAGISVVLAPSRPFPASWDQKRILPGPPLTYETAITVLLAKNVNVAIGVIDEFNARHTRFEVAWAALESNGRIGKAQATALASTNLERALGLESNNITEEFVVYQGGDMFDMQSKVIGVVSGRRGDIDLF